MKEKDNKTKNISFRLTEEDLTAIAEYAEKEDLTVSQVVRRAVKQFLESNKE